MFAASSQVPGSTSSVPRAKAFGRAVRPAEIQKALALGQFIAVFQPFVHPRTGAVALLEATVRWLHPLRGLLAPCDFLCEADQYGLMDDIALELSKQVALAELRIPISVSLSGAVLRSMSTQLPISESIASLQALHKVDLSHCSDTRAALTPLLIRREGGAGIALTGVGTLLKWYVASEYDVELVQGDFICPPMPYHVIGEALQRWRLTFDAINASSETRALPLPNQH
jgi:EAL domain-containing protein (putative c-di-GMP-specific phosphodiesterase class I)